MLREAGRSTPHSCTSSDHDSAYGMLSIFDLGANIDIISSISPILCRGKYEGHPTLEFWQADITLDLRDVVHGFRLIATAIRTCERLSFTSPDPQCSWGLGLDHEAA